MAVLSLLSNCCEWASDDVQKLVMGTPGNRDLVPKEIKKILRDHVRAGGRIHCTKEARENWIEKREFYYWVVATVDDIPKGLFIEMELTNEDLEYPVVALVGAHPSTER
jgi:hypothetical protein